MPTVDILSPAGKKAGSVDLPDDIFDVQTNIPLIHQVVVGQLAAARQGTASTKTRGEVRGGGRKPHKQKGTGRARQGSTRAPQFVGGGVVHGPKPRDYSQRTPKKMKAAALRGALSDRARHGRIHVFSSLVEGEKPSTKAAWAILDGLSERKNLLVVVDRADVTSWTSLRNLENVHVLVPDQLNTYDVLCADDIVFTEGSLSTFLAGPTKGRSEKDEAVDAVQDAPTADRAATPEDVSVKAEPATTEGAGAFGRCRLGLDADVFGRGRPVRRWCVLDSIDGLVLFGPALGGASQEGAQRALREDDVVGAQDVVGVELVRDQHVYVLEVAKARPRSGVVAVDRHEEVLALGQTVQDRPC